ncbi:MAG: MotA/TolQ/ExbB proton channel family protein [Candidatus Zixiibacteriota bacterium]
MHNGLPVVIANGSLWQIIQSLSTFGAVILAILVAMSLASWMVIFRKIRQFRAVHNDSRSFITYFRRAHRLEDASGQAQMYRNAPVANIFKAGFQEITGLKQRRNEASGLREATVPLNNEDYDLVEMAMERSLNDEMAKQERQVVYLATTASSAPFLGLLGTVVGIMDSFWSIGERGSASLAIVAPGIAEALLATIVGLGAAIPAVIAYNWANNHTKFTNNDAMNFILEFVARARKEAM